MNRLLLASTFAVSAALYGCGGNECKLDDPSTCATDLACEVVQGQEKPACFPPVEIRGKVFDLDSAAAIRDARVTSLDVNGAPVGSGAVTLEDGTYALRIPTERSDEKGTPVGRTLTLRASAKDYQTFPSGLRLALPLDTSGAAQAEEGQPWIVTSEQADLGLSRLPGDVVGLPSISGHVDVQPGQAGVLVVAENGGEGGHSAIADANGDFVIFNVPPGPWKVRAYSRGVNYTPADANVETGKNLTGLEIARSDVEPATLKGTVQIVSASGVTSVVMVVKSTFIENLARGEVPPGLRAPDAGKAPDITGSFEITGVPDGDYVVLAAFENDGLVRDPDTSIGGTELQFVTVANGVPSKEVSFKVTDAIELVSPGAGDAVDEVSATPTLTWKPYSSAKMYRVLVFDALGVEKWNSGFLQNLPTSGDISVPYTGTALEAGKLYQWRAVTYSGSGTPISQTEDLKGLFRVK